MKTIFNNFLPHEKEEKSNSFPFQPNQKQNFDRNWLESYKINPKKDNILYKNYQNEGLSKWDTQFGSLSPAQKTRYFQFLNSIPSEIKGLSAVEMQKYLQDVDSKQKVLTEEKVNYENKVQNLKSQQAAAAVEAQRQAQIRAQQAAAAEAQRQAQIRAHQQAVLQAQQAAAAAEAQRQAQIRAQQAAQPRPRKLTVDDYIAERNRVTTPEERGRDFSGGPHAEYVAYWNQPKFNRYWQMVKEVTGSLPPK